MSDRSSDRKREPTPDLLEVGRIGKSHGLRGEVAVAWTTNMVDQRSAVGTKLSADGEWFTITAARPHQDRWLVAFEGVCDRNQADRLRGRTLKAEPIESEADVFVHELVGKALVDQHGVHHGPVAAVVANPASDLIELDDGRLIPLAFYRSHDDLEIVVDVPAGLLDGDSL